MYSKRFFWLMGLCMVALAGCGPTSGPGNRFGESEAFQNDRAARYSQNVALLAPEFASNSTMPADRLMFLCNAYYGLRDYAQLFVCIERFADNIQIKGDESAQPEPPMPHLIEARAQLELQNLAAADKSLETAFSLIESGNANTVYTAQALGLRGVLRVLQGEAEDARVDLSLLETLECQFYGRWVCEDDRLLSRVSIFVALKDFRAARDLLAAGADTDAARASAFARTHYVDDGWLFKELPRAFLKAYLDYQLEDYDQAESGFQAILDRPQIAANSTIHWNSLAMLGQIRARRGDVTSALALIGQSLEIIEQQRKSIDTEAARIGFVADKASVYGAMVKLLVDNGQASEALQYAERAKSRSLVDMLAARRSFATTNRGSTGLLERLNDLEARSVVVDANAGVAKTRGAALEQTRSELKQSAPELASLVSVSSADTLTIQSLLAPDEVLIEYYGQQQWLYAFVVSRQRVVVVEIDGADLMREVGALRASLTEIDTIDYQPHVFGLYDRLLKPLSGFIDGYPKITIVPHGVLHYLPFSALYDGEQFFIEKHVLRLLPSASVLAFLGKKVTDHEQLLAIGNPDLGNPEYDLPGTEAETRFIRTYWEDSKMLLRGSASEANFKRFSPQYKYLHIASHGEFDAENPLASRLLLAPGEGEDGSLNVGELYDLRIAAELVTLSACETGLSRVRNGDDLIGLTRGFFYAGAESVVASLWAVSDDATAQLMQSFYSILKAMPTASALREAMLSTRQKYSHPYFWAAFTISGGG